MSDPDGLTALESRLGHTFTDPGLLRLALTHRSAAAFHNERLEFLGDAVLGLCTADMLYRRHPQETEGALSRLRAGLVNRDTLSGLAIQLGIGEHLVLGAGERKSGGRRRPSILCDAMEAVLGAVYLDAGLNACQRCVERLFSSVEAEHGKDAKTRLQELMQARGLPLPVYDTIDITGEEHEQLFVVTCQVSLLPGRIEASGATRRAAEQNAAAHVLQQLESQQ